MSATGRYLAILRAPHVGSLLASALLGRLPIGIEGLAVVLYLRSERGSFALAGAVAGSLAVGAGIGAPFAGRLIDRLGQRRVLLPLALVHAAALVALLALTEAGAPAAALLAVGAVVGASVPPLSSVLRSLWPSLLDGRPELLATAFALDSVLIELLFIGGPLLTALAVALFAPAAALVLSAAVVVAGTLAFVTRPPSRDWAPGGEGGAGLLGALRSPGLQTLVVSMVPVGFCLGAVEVTLPAFAESEGQRGLAGVLLAVWSFGSAIGGLAYGARHRTAELGPTFLRLAALLPLAYVPLAAAPASLPAMLVLVLPAGAAIAPLLAAGNQLVGEIAPAGAVTEAYTWPITSLVCGIALGATAAGAIVEAADWRAAFLAASLVGALGGLIGLARRDTLAAQPALLPA